jgi:O-6-methylguanine DNA methyltransferase
MPTALWRLPETCPVSALRVFWEEKEEARLTGLSWVWPPTWQSAPSPLSPEISPTEISPEKLPHHWQTALHAYWRDARFDALQPLQGQSDFPAHATSFQKAVWQALAHIPAGRPWTYGTLAAALGRPPGAARAVGQALRANPLPLIYPCHRVVPAPLDRNTLDAGSPGGYCGKVGLPLKIWLLAYECSHPARQQHA